MKKFLLVLILMVSGGCVILPTAPSVPMSPSDGKRFDLYLEEDGKCRQVAERQIGRYYDYFSTQEAQYHYDNIYVQCMQSYGNLLLQSPTVYRWYRIPRPPPQDYNDPPPDDYPGPHPETSPSPE